MNLQRPLTAVEIETVAAAILQALDGKTLRIVQTVGRRTDHSEMLMGQGGAARVIRFELQCVEIVNGECIAGRVPPRSATERPERYVNVIDFTGVQGRRCNGLPATGEMVAEYVLKSSTQTWTAIARERRPDESTVPRPLQMLRTAASLISWELRRNGTRTERILTLMSPQGTDVRVTGDPAPNPADFVPMESLRVDTATLLPVRWQGSHRQAIVAAVDFIYEPIDLRPPAGTQVPSCIP